VFPDLLVLEFGLKSGSVECISMARRTHFCEDLISEQDALNDENVAETLDGCFRRDAPVNLVPQENPQENPHESPHGPRKTFSIFLRNFVESLCRNPCRSWAPIVYLLGTNWCQLSSSCMLSWAIIVYFLGTNCRCAPQ
jgi:hypothetical protein